MEILKYTSGMLQISQSACYQNMFIIDDGSGKFWNISCSREYILAKYPPGRKPKLVRTLIHYHNHLN